jgi:7,8-dihydro-6-hydroxymethylpterin dimethyltransferase
MTELPAQTQSLCPHCLRLIPAYRTIEDDSVWLEKRCPACGDLGKVLIWKNVPKTYNDWRRNCEGTTPTAAQTAAEAENHCPFDCGLCLNHKQETCTAIIEVTNRCNLYCPVCFADSGKASGPDPDQSQIAQMLQTVLSRSGPHPIQLSGGEPTIRDDLPQIVAMARRMGFDHIQINTNGIRLSREKDYAKALKEAGAMAIFLQFDGISDDVYRRLRGADLFSLKLKAIENCAEAKIGVILVPTLARDVNIGQIGAIIQFAKKWIPTVKGVHFQPMTYLGRHPDAPRNEDRILIPEILLAIEEQTEELKMENLVPPG